MKHSRPDHCPGVRYVGAQANLSVSVTQGDDSTTPLDGALTADRACANLRDECPMVAAIRLEDDLSGRVLWLHNKKKTPRQVGLYIVAFVQIHNHTFTY